MTINDTPITPSEVSAADNEQVTGHEHLGASPRPRHYSGRHRRTRKTD